mgnify:CR=1 FL=1
MALSVSTTRTGTMGDQRSVFGTITFDSSYDKGAPASFPLGNVIEGWQKGLKGKKDSSFI